jgi:hypothetical protein
MLTTAALAAMFATLPTALAFAPADAAAPAPGGSVKAYAITNDGGNAVIVTASMYCTSPDTVTLDMVVSQTVSGNEPAPYGKTAAKVPCSTNIEDTRVRVPILRDGPVTSGRMMVVATDMLNSAGRKIHSDSNMLRIQG